MFRPLHMLLAAALWSAVVATASACPLCDPMGRTLAEEINSVEVAAFVKLIEAPPPIDDSIESKELDLNTAPPKAKFEVVEMLKNQGMIAPTGPIESPYFGQSPVGTLFLLLGYKPPELRLETSGAALTPSLVMWATPIEMSDRGKQYLTESLKLPKEGPDRLVYFLNYLEDAEEMLRKDAYDEFARAPYKDVMALKGKLNRDLLVARIWDSQLPASRRRLYLMMLSVCGGEKDILMLETILKSEIREVKQGLDATIACYLSLKGQDGLPLIEELYLKNPKAEYTDVYAAIMALRVHGQEVNDIIPRPRVIEAMRHMLDQPKLADLIIPDLARWEDWWVLERLVTLFKEADEESNWVRVPVISYLKVCPLPKAKMYLEELAALDPDAMRRANSFSPFGAPVGPAPSATPTAADQAGANATPAVEQAAAGPAGEGTADVVAQAPSVQTAPAGESSAAAASSAAKEKPPASDDPGSAPTPLEGEAVIPTAAQTLPDVTVEAPRKAPQTAAAAKATGETAQPDSPPEKSRAWTIAAAIAAVFLVAIVWGLVKGPS